MALTLVLLLFPVVASINPPFPVPAKPYGIEFNAKSVGAEDQLEFFCCTFENKCDEAWHLVMRLQSYYGPKKLRAVYKEVSMPSHVHSLLGAQALFAMEKLNDSRLVIMLKTLIHSKLSNQDTYNLTQTEVLDIIAKKGADVSGLSVEKFKSEMLAMRNAASNQWKYVTARAVNYIPQYFVNGVDIMGGPRTYTFREWVKFLDPIILK